jgi:hypothetical protein
MAHGIDVIDPAGFDPAAAERRQDLQSPLHSIS